MLLASVPAREAGVDHDQSCNDIVQCRTRGCPGKQPGRYDQPQHERQVEETQRPRHFCHGAYRDCDEHGACMAKGQMERRLRKRRVSSKLPDLIELVLSRPLVSTGMIQERLKVTKQGALSKMCICLSVVMGRRTPSRRISEIADV